MTHYGALKNDWRRFDLYYGLTEDLLPVVSNPTAKLSENSKLGGIGKVPSLYNAAGKVVGMIDWTAKRSLPQEVDSWSTNPDYGICIQTRRLRAIDIDVDDPTRAAAYVAYLDRKLGVTLPVRNRVNSGKCLLAFIYPGEFGKKVMRVDGGIIELLANGQQFVAVGTHPSGCRYEWDWRDNDTFPIMSDKTMGSLLQ